jgi:hypothetical protein
VTGLDDLLSGMPDGKAVPGSVPSLIGYLTSEAIAARHQYRDRIAKLNTDLRAEFTRLYGPAILGAQYVETQHKLQVGVSRAEPAEEHKLIGIADANGCAISVSGFTHLYLKGTNDSVATCWMAKGPSIKPLKYVVNVDLDYENHEALLKALLEDYLGLTRVDNAPG